MSGRRPELAIATGAALAAYLLAFVPLALPRWATVALAIAAAGGALASGWSRVSPGVARWSWLGLRVLVVAIGALVVFSRQFPLVRYGNARQAGALIGGALAIGALGFLAGRRVFSVGRCLLPAIAGLLVAAGMEPEAPHFVPLASVTALALWIDAFRTGGPRRFGAPVVITGAAGAALAAGIAWFLPVAQPHVQEFVARAYGEGRTGLSDRSELGEVASLALSRRVVARVWTNRPQLLRMQVFMQFDGRRWVSFPRDGRLLRRVDRTPLGPLLDTVPGDVYARGAVDAAGLTETRILRALSVEEGWGLLAPAGSVGVVWPESGLALDDRGLVTTGGVRARLYGVLNRPAAGVPVPPAEVDLALPVRLDPRVRELADSLRRGEAPSPALVERTVDHLRSSYRYTLDVGRFETSDPLAEFLFDKRAGYCEYFATAAVVLLRLQGVPARYVKGASVRPDRLVGEHHVVRESDAHAWVDAWIEGRGWTEVDPTPADGWVLTHPDERASAFERLWEHVATFAAQAWARWRQGTWPWLVAVLWRGQQAAWAFVVANRWAIAVLSLAIAAAVVQRRRRPFARTPRAGSRTPMAPELAAALRRIERHWARSGNARPPSRGLLEHLEALPAGALTAEVLLLSRQVIDAVHETAFGERTLAPADLEALAAATDTLPRWRRASR